MERRILTSLVVALAVLSVLASMAVAQDGQVAPVDRVDELLAMTPADIQALDADEREALAQEVEALVIEKTEQAMQLSQQLENVRQQARETDPEVKNIEQNIAELRSRLHRAIENNPDVKAASEKLSRVQQTVLQLIKTKRLVNQ